jgi:hypothetical protein
VLRGVARHLPVIARFAGTRLHVDDVAVRARLTEGAAPLRPGDLVLPEQELDALRVLRDDVVLPLQHAREIEAHAVEVDAVVLGVEARELVVLRGLEQRLRGNAADVDAGAAERLVHLDAHGGEPELGGADRRDVAARAAADHDDVGLLLTVGHV